MAPATKPPTFNQFLRENDIESNPENLATLGKHFKKAPSKTSQVPIERIEEAKKLFNSNGSQPAKASPTPSEAPPHPAYAAYQGWEDTIVFVRSDFPVVATWDAEEGRGVKIIKYKTPDGGERVTNSRVLELRGARRGGRGLPYFLLARENENDGIGLVAQFPGALTKEARCLVCGKPLFATEAALRASLRDVLENILCNRTTPIRARFRRRHDECNMFQHQWQDGFQGALHSLQSRLAVENASDDVRKAQLEELKEAWKRKAGGLINWMWHQPWSNKQTLKDLREVVAKEMA